MVTAMYQIGIQITPNLVVGWEHKEH